MEQPVFNERKFRELILYLATKCGSDPYFGATKLNKLLFYSDFATYKVLGAAITGAEYQALSYGPAPTKLLPIRDKMRREGLVALEAWGPQHRLVALREPDLSVFSASEIAAVDLVIARLAGLSSEEASELSHGFLGWKAAMAESMAAEGKKVTIHYGTAFVSNRRLDEFERAHLAELGRRRGWFTAA